MNKEIKKLSDKEKYVKLRDEMKKEELKEDDKENLILEFEQIILNQKMIIKSIEIFLIPLFIATLGFVFSTFKTEMLKGLIVYMISSLIEIVMIIWIYYITARKKYFAEKILKLIEKNNNNNL